MSLNLSVNWSSRRTTFKARPSKDPDVQPSHTRLLTKRIIQHLSFLEYRFDCVNALSGLYLISTVSMSNSECAEMFWCQCPLGLIPHFYQQLSCFRTGASAACQCPLGLIPHFYGRSVYDIRKLFKPCQCPLGLIPHFYEYRVALGSDAVVCQCPLGLIPHFYPQRTYEHQLNHR